MVDFGVMEARSEKRVRLTIRNTSSEELTQCTVTITDTPAKGKPVPFTIEGFGCDLSGIKPHEGSVTGQCAPMGAQAVAAGSAVAFGPGSAELTFACHEAAHTVQVSLTAASP